MNFNIPATRRSPNPLFLVLTILSGIPTAFFLLVFVSEGPDGIIGALFLWSAMWTWVWWKLADRYR